MTSAWYEKRFVEDPKKVRSDCSECQVAMYFPPSHAGRYLTCGEKCAAARRERLTAYRNRQCLSCGIDFKPRSTRIAAGGGKYCCNACAAPTRAAGRTAEAIVKRGISIRAGYATGRIIPKRGAANGNWSGGKEAHRERQRQKDPVARAAKRRAYLAANPEKAREWTDRRRSASTGKRLPKGTVKRIGDLQRWRCAICRIDVRNKYHLDHILPVAKGGKHEADNLQILCPTCNVQKSAKHPIAFMQERGFLL